MSGPILRKKLENGASRTVVGFRMSGQFLDQKDGDPPALPVYRAKESVLANLSAHPLVANGGSGANAAENLTRDSVDVFKYRPNNGRRDVDLTGKLDFRLTNAIDFSVTGTFNRRKSSPLPEATANSTWALLNSQNNPTKYERRYRGLARFRHRLGNSDPGKNELYQPGRRQCQLPDPVRFRARYGEPLRQEPRGQLLRLRLHR